MDMQTAALQPPQKKPEFVLKRLSPKHKQAASLLAQGLGREEIAEIVKCTPEYITMLARQPIFIEYMREMSKFADARLEALFGQAVDVLAKNMKNGQEGSQLKAAGMVMQANGKAGTLNVNAKVQHTHSLLGILQSMPAATPVPKWNAPVIEEKVVESSPSTD